MIKTDAVRREIEHAKRAVTEQSVAAPGAQNLITWLNGTYYKSENGESQLLLFVAKYPWNANSIKEYIEGTRKNLRLKTKNL